MFESKHIAYLIIIGICLIGSGFFSGSETAFSTFNRIRMKKLAQDGNRKAKKVLGIGGGRYDESTVRALKRSGEVCFCKVFPDVFAPTFDSFKKRLIYRKIKIL